MDLCAGPLEDLDAEKVQQTLTNILCELRNGGDYRLFSFVVGVGVFYLKASFLIDLGVDCAFLHKDLINVIPL